LRDTVYTGLNISKKTKVVAAIIITVSVLNIPLNIAFIYLFSSMGAAIATAVSQLLYLVLVWKYSQKYYHIPFELSKIVKIFITGAVLSVVAALSNRLPLVTAILIKFVLFISFPFILYFWNFFEPIELDRLHGLWLKWKKPARWKANIKSLRKPSDSEPKDSTSP
jgi:O-antigen/teichoic acid export membrane protein